MEIDDLMARLLTEEPTGFVRVDEERDVRYQTLPSGQMIRSSTAVKSEVLKKLRNPDGPAAFAALEALRAERDALQSNLRIAMNTLQSEGVCPADCMACSDARKALGD